MSFLAVAWAETAPVADVYERAIITLMAHRANSDGTGCYPSIATMAAYACCEATTIKRRLAAMRARKLIGYGDQKLVKHLPRDKQPKVYDLLIPLGWYSAAQLEEVTRDRAGRGLRPLAEAERPMLEAVMTSRKPRADVGIARPHRRKAAAVEEPGSPSSKGNGGGAGVLQAPPVEDPTGESSNEDGGATSTVAGVLVATSRGCYKHPKTVHPPTVGNSPGDQSPGGLTAAPQTPADTITDSPTDVGTDQLELVGDPHQARASPEPGASGPDPEAEIAVLLDELAEVAARVEMTEGREAFDAARQLTALRAQCRDRGADPAAITAAEQRGYQLLASMPAKTVTTRTNRHRTARRRGRR